MIFAFFAVPDGVFFYLRIKKSVKSSAIQKISVILSSVNMAIFLVYFVFLSITKLLKISLFVKFTGTYNSSNSR